MLEVTDSPLTSSPSIIGHSINWIKYSKYFSETDHPANLNLKTADDIDAKINKFINLIITTVENYFYSLVNRKNRKGWLTVIITEICDKNQIFREWQGSRDPHLKIILNSKTMFIRNMLKVNRKDEWDAFLDNLDA